jgi:hypothetical protein
VRLHLLFQSHAELASKDHAIVDPNQTSFCEGLAGAPITDRLLCKSIEDLARIAGVNLWEHGM